MRTMLVSLECPFGERSNPVGALNDLHVHPELAAQPLNIAMYDPLLDESQVSNLGLIFRRLYGLLPSVVAISGFSSLNKLSPAGFEKSPTMFQGPSSRTNPQYRQILQMRWSWLS